MPSLPISTAFTDSAVTEAGFKTAITNQREFLAGLLGTTGNQIDALKAMGVPLNDTVAKTGAYTVIAADRGVTLLCSGTFTVSLTAAATLGDGFTFAVVNTGSGTITIDPNSTEQIDGQTTKTISAGSSAIVTTNGTAFYSVGGGGNGALIGYQIFTANGTYTKGTNNPSFVIVEVVGGGGAGQGYPSSSTGSIAGAGGGGGGYARKIILASSLGASVTVTVGTGGIGGTGAGPAGNTSSFGAFCSATGGGSSVITGVYGPQGGIGVNGDINIVGGGGGTGGIGPSMGGSTFYSGNTRSSVNGGGNGTSGILGAGGSGASLTSTGANRIGGNGGTGVVIVWEYK